MTTKEQLKELKSFNLIHRIYQEALTKSHNILEIVENFRNLLKSTEEFEKIPDDEKENFLKFVSAVDDCYFERKSTFQLTNLLVDVQQLMLYIVLYFNTFVDDSHRIDININSRRKSLKRDLAKMLRKSYTGDASSVKDRFGLRGIVLNNDLSEKETEELLLSISKFILGILTNSNDKVDEFKKWINNNNSIDDFTKLRISQTLSLPFKIDRVKNLVSTPKENGYKSFHATIVLPVYSKVCPGATIDIQFRTFDMHRKATDKNDDASHTKYEEETLLYSKIFEVDDFSKLQIIGFSGNTPEEDMDGINNHKPILNRRVSASLVR